MGSNSGEQHLEPGFHKFPFQIPLPPHCPSSFEGDYGHVRYDICIVVDRAFKLDQEKEIRIAVAAPVDLNADPELRNPVCMELEESYCCWCMSSGDVKTCVRFPTSGLVPGQTINIELACDNRSNVAMQKVKMAIKQHSHFIAHSAPGQRSGDTRTIVEVKKGPIPAKTSRSWMATMEVPPDTQPSGLANCHIISMGYVFKVTVVAEGCHSNAESEHTLCIGTVPLRDLSDNAPYQERDTDPLIPQDASKNNAQFPMPYPNTHGDYSGANPPYPEASPPYPGPNPSYPGANPPYPGANPPYPGPNPSYPGANPPYPVINQQYPGANPPYPVVNQPYPNSNQLHNTRGSFPYHPSVYPTAPFEAQSLPYSNKKEQEAIASYPNAPPSASAAASNAEALHPPSYASATQGQGAAPASLPPPLPYPAAELAGASAPPPPPPSSSLPSHMSVSDAGHAPSTPAAPPPDTGAPHSSST